MYDSENSETSVSMIPGEVVTYRNHEVVIGINTLPVPIVLCLAVEKIYPHYLSPIPVYKETGANREYNVPVS